MIRLGSLSSAGGSQGRDVYYSDWIEEKNFSSWAYSKSVHAFHLCYDCLSPNYSWRLSIFSVEKVSLQQMLNLANAVALINFVL